MDHPGPEQFNELLKRYLRESLNPQELNLFFELAAAPENSGLLADSFRNDLENNPVDLSSAGQREAAWARLQSKMDLPATPVRHIGPVLRWAAILVCLLGAAVAVYIFNQSKTRAEFARSKSEIKTPAWLTAEHIGATLFLADGDSVILNNQERGVIAKQDGIEVIQSGGAILYSGKSHTTMYNEIRTDKGKLYRMILPDQTVVWLNGGSSIKYPLTFGTDARSVEMTGEIYFEVAHHADYPFLIKSGGVQIEDIGTIFNINSFADNPSATATLVEGSARVTVNNREATLIAGQQSVISAGKNEISIVKNVNLTQVLAWKNGFFYFQNASLKDVMKQISDWYQVGVVYQGNPGKELFNGQIDKTLSLADVLQGLQQPGVKFSLDSLHQITVIRQ
jgi:transmembrane sensor